VGDQISALDAELRTVDEQLTAAVAGIPNCLTAHTLRQGRQRKRAPPHGGRTAAFDFEPKPHWTWARAGIINFEQA